MNVESRDSVSLKPAELDEFGQLLASNGLPLSDEQLDVQVESFPLAIVASLDGELTRRAAISFPDEDVLVGARLAHPSCYVLLQSYADVVPRPGYTANGEDRAWGRRLAKRYGCEPHFDDRAFKVTVKGRKPPCMPVLDTSPVKATGGAKIASLVGELDATRGQAMIAFGWA